jgi:hypothetical protein
MEIEKIKTLLEQLKEECKSLKDQKLQSNLLSYINEMENLLSDKNKNEDQDIINQMEENKKQDYMTRFMAE